MRTTAIVVTPLVIVAAVGLFFIRFRETKINECPICRLQVRFHSTPFGTFLDPKQNEFSSWYTVCVETNHVHVWHLRASGTYNLYGNLVVSQNVGSERLWMVNPDAEKEFLASGLSKEEVILVAHSLVNKDFQKAFYDFVYCPTNLDKAILVREAQLHK